MKKRGLTCFQLKWIAVASMVIDHLTIVLRALPLEWSWYGYQIGRVCGVLGSAGFPIFCFCAVEGFQHTRDRRRYLAGFLLLALVTEIPFDLAHYGALWEPKLQNVMFTLTVCVLTLWVISFVEEHFIWEQRFALTVLAVLAGMALAYLLRGEYVFLGVAAAALTYLLRDKGRWRLAGLAPLLAVSPWVLLALPPLLCYDGSRGKGPKWFFYFFYPAHFLVLAALAAVLAGG